MIIKRNTFLILPLLSPIMYSCDAKLSLEYIADNSVKFRIYDYKTGRFDFIEDTTRVLISGEEIRVSSKEKTGFPWETKTIYNENPGIDNFELINNDSVISIKKDLTSGNIRMAEAFSIFIDR